MRTLILFISVFIFLSCQTEKKHQKPNWLLGKWIRISDKPDKTTYEFWNEDFTGIGFTLKQKDTVFKEILSIILKNDSLYLQVTGVNENPTLFKFTQQTKNSFTCENNLNEFPKRINYFTQNDTLKAKVSNEEFTIDFSFIKLKD
ncbi:hypothetical protein C7447_103142 [Tenacibaculum adriaticum]|uniref:Lipocalin-like protein n=1 Tax=Tenacibaculum adriaticum TaxID=413713 RepID=A0A5S5DQG8_9FLAO|nr:DUF6265 family protein [Tenacibaculum adriaticum]TYP97975.1 hypothetical protein C7447_103142 [Tenacibaculum adriaticum]